METSIMTSSRNKCYTPKTLLTFKRLNVIAHVKTSSIWALSRENLSSVVRDRVRLKPVSSATETSERLQTLGLATIGIILSKQRTTKLQIRLWTGRGSSIGSVSPWHASGLEFDPHVRQILSWRLGHEKILRPFSLFHWFKKAVWQLLAKECALSTGKLPRGLAQEQCG